MSMTMCPVAALQSARRVPSRPCAHCHRQSRRMGREEHADWRSPDRIEVRDGRCSDVLRSVWLRHHRSRNDVLRPPAVRLRHQPRPEDRSRLRGRADPIVDGPFGVEEPRPAAGGHRLRGLYRSPERHVRPRQSDVQRPIRSAAPDRLRAVALCDRPLSLRPIYLGGTGRGCLLRSRLRDHGVLAAHSTLSLGAARNLRGGVSHSGAGLRTSVRAVLCHWRACFWVGLGFRTSRGLSAPPLLSSPCICGAFFPISRPSRCSPRWWRRSSFSSG